MPVSSSVQSAPCATPEAANDMLSGLLLDAGRNQEITVVSTEIHEVDGLWIATAVFQLEEPEATEEEDVDDEVNKDRNEGKLGLTADTEGNGDIAFLHGVPGSIAGEPSPAQDIPEAQDIKVDPETQQHALEVIREEQLASGEETHDEILEQDIKVAENLQKEFEQAEKAVHNMDEAIIVSSHDQQQARNAGLTYEERREEEEEARERRELEELERLRQEAVPLPVEAPAETPL